MVLLFEDRNHDFHWTPGVDKAFGNIVKNGIAPTEYKVYRIGSDSTLLFVYPGTRYTGSTDLVTEFILANEDKGTELRILRFSAPVNYPPFMPRKARIIIPGSVHHVMARGLD